MPYLWHLHLMTRLMTKVLFPKIKSCIDGFSALRGSVDTTCCGGLDSICYGTAGEWVAGAGEGRPIVVASSHHGLVETELLAEPLGAHDDLLSSTASDGNHKVS